MFLRSSRSASRSLLPLEVLALGLFPFLTLPLRREAGRGEEAGAALVVATEVPGREPVGLLRILEVVRGMLQGFWLVFLLRYSRV